MLLDHFSIHLSIAVHVDYNMRTPNFWAQDECDCMDAPDIIPAGSTIKFNGVRGDFFEAPSRIYRDCLK